MIIERSGKGRCYNVAVISTALALSIFSQIPVALPALDYDLGYKELGFTVLLISGSLIPIRSIQLSLDKIFEKRLLNDTQKQIESIRENAVSCIGNYRETFRGAPFDQKLALISNLNLTRSMEDLEPYLAQIFEETDVPQVAQNPLLGRVSTVIGWWITASFEAALTTYTFEKSKENIFDDNVLAGTFAVVTGLSWGYLTGQAVVGTTKRIAQTCVNFFKGQSNPSIAEQIFPNLTAGLKLLGAAISIAAMGPTFVIWGDYYKDNLEKKVYFLTTMSTALVFLLSTASFDMIDGIVQNRIEKNGTLDEQSIVKLDKELRKFQQLLSQSSLFDFASFLETCPADIKNKLLARAEVTAEGLREYLDQERSNIPLQRLNGERSSPSYGTTDVVVMEE